jgi:hypothetical protein
MTRRDAQESRCNRPLTGVSHRIKGKEVLKGVSGVAKTGELLAIMGCVPEDDGDDDDDDTDAMMVMTMMVIITTLLMWPS